MLLPTRSEVFGKKFSCSSTLLLKEVCLRMGLLEASMTAGSLLGMLSTSYLYKAFGYTYVFLTCAGFMGLSVLYTFFIIKETKKMKSEPEDDKVGNQNKKHDLENIKHYFAVAKCKKPIYLVDSKGTLDDSV